MVRLVSSYISELLRQSEVHAESSIRLVTNIPVVTLKAESHCSDNENDNDHDAKRMHSIGELLHG